MEPTPRDGRRANERGYPRTACPVFGSERERWLQEWDDAQIDREVWEDENFHRADAWGET